MSIIKDEEMNKLYDSIKIGGLYKHFKGNIYKVLNIGINTETLEYMVIYTDLNNENIWVRPISMWNDIINNQKRFTCLSNDFPC